MELTPEERHRIYEEEKARIEAEREQEKSENELSLNLPQNIASMLCYALFWISGIIFLVLEKKDKVVGFHAIQSIVLFGGLSLLSACLSWIPYAGGFFGVAIAILAFILWVVLMVKSYQGELYKVPVAGDIAESIHKSVWKTEAAADIARENNKENQQEKTGKDAAGGVSAKTGDFGKRVDNYFTRTRAGRITGYSFAIFWNVILIIFFSFFYEYIAWYSVGEDGALIISPMLTPDYLIWQPVLITSLAVCIVANIMLIVYDRYWFREAVQILLEVIGIAVVVYLIVVFPFDFGVIPNATVAGIMPAIMQGVLIFVAVAFGVSVLVRFLKLVFNIEEQEYTS
jgi:uncharacterized membrane protein